MKKVIYSVVVAMLVCGTAMSGKKNDRTENNQTNLVIQKDTVKKVKKESGFLKALKKGVESTTGLDVSKEVLFVYPTIGEWKMQLASCNGDLATGTVAITIKAMNLTGKNINSVWCNLQAATSAGKSFEIKSRGSDPFFNFESGVFTDVTFVPILGVPTDTKMVNCKFKIFNSGEFELRDAAIDWK